MLPCGTVDCEQEEIIILIACLRSLKGIQMSSSSPVSDNDDKGCNKHEIAVALKNMKSWSQILTRTRTRKGPTGIIYVTLQQDLECIVKTIHIRRIQPQEPVQCKKISSFLDSFHKKPHCWTKFDRIRTKDIPLESHESGCPWTTKDKANQCLFAKIWPPQTTVAMCPASRKTPPHVPAKLKISCLSESPSLGIGQRERSESEALLKSSFLFNFLPRSSSFCV